MDNTLLDRVFRDESGNVILAQFPNLPLIVWLVATLLKLVFTTGVINSGLEILAFGALFTWAWQELFGSDSDVVVSRKACQI